MRKPPPKKHENLERWVISYADFTTLLLATFVMLYAISSINSSKFQQMSEAFKTAFTGYTPRIVGPGLAAPNRAPFSHLPSPVAKPIVVRTPHPAHLPPGTLQRALARRAQRLNRVYHRLLALLGKMIGQGKVNVSLQSLGVVININAVVLFKSGKAKLTPTASQILDHIAAVVKGIGLPIQVNGFTDTRPIHDAQFDSNWDLSAARAIAVVKRFAAAGIDPRSLVGAGYGQYHPVASNDTVVGRAKNRRVSIVVVSSLENKALPETPLVGSPTGRARPVPPTRDAAPAAVSKAAPPAVPPAVSNLASPAVSRAAPDVVPPAVSPAVSRAAPAAVSKVGER